MNEWVEAETMAALAVRAGFDSTAIITETEAPNSWENAANSRELTADFDTVVLVSDPLHAARVRSYWLAQEPSDAHRIFIAPTEHTWRDMWILIPASVLELARRARDLFRR